MNPSQADTAKPLIPPTFLFRIRSQLRHTNKSWSATGCELGADYLVPGFHAELNAGPRFADFRLGWNRDGLIVYLRVEGKKKSPWCRDTRLEDSDGLNLLIDTRDTQNIHRASRFCHRFILLPQGAGRLLDQPVARLAEIHRARENPKPIPADLLSIRSEKRIDGYLLQAHIPAAALTGFDPAEHPTCGFNYVVIDREIGWQSFLHGPELPFLSDPSLWGSMRWSES